MRPRPTYIYGSGLKPGDRVYANIDQSVDKSKILTVTDVKFGVNSKGQPSFAEQGGFYGVSFNGKPHQLVSRNEIFILNATRPPCK